MDDIGKSMKKNLKEGRAWCCSEYQDLVYDNKASRSNEIITRCPECGRVITYQDLNVSLIEEFSVEH